MPLDHAWLLAHIPHQGSMCLLDVVTGWDGQHIRCTASSHRRADNPLRAHGRLGVACGIEYAAQAMAAHGALLASGEQPPRAGYLASVRSVDCRVARLDDILTDLEIEAERLSGDDNLILYGFRVSAAGRDLLTGRATVVLNADKLKTEQSSSLSGLKNRSENSAGRGQILTISPGNSRFIAQESGEI